MAFEGGGGGQEEYEEDEDLSGSVWMPVIVESKKQLEEITRNDPSVKEMDLAAISEKEVFVRKANLVREYTFRILIQHIF